MLDKDYKKCPICAKEIKLDAIKCKHCKSYLAEADNAFMYSGSEPKRQSAGKLIILGFILLVIIAFFVASKTSLPSPAMLGSRSISVPSHYNTIQEAINASRNGDTIIVEPGIYKENIDYIGKNITLSSTNPDDSEIVESTVIDGGGNGTVVSFISDEGELATLTGFTITGGGEGGIVVSNESSPQIINNIITKNCYSRRKGGGINVRDNSSPYIAGNVISNNNFSTGGGISVISSSPVIEGNMIINNNADSEFHRCGGIYIHDSTVDIKGNTITGNHGHGSAIYITGKTTSSVHLEGNNIYDNLTHEMFAHMIPFGIAVADEVSEKSSVVYENNFIRPDHGAVLAGSRPGGPYMKDLKVDNGLTLDAVVVIVDKMKHDQVIKAVYIRAEDSFDIGNLSASEADVYFMIGENWDPQEKKFIDVLSYHRLDYDYDFSRFGSHYEITLHGVPGGTIRTEDLSEDDFPRLK